MHHIAIFASGEGTNAEAIINYFRHHPHIRVALVISNRKDAGVVRKAKNNGIPVLIIDRESFYETERLLEVLKHGRIDFIVLAGFLWLIPDYLIRAFKNKMVNIHPALLPKYGGKGMYGMKVHQAVVENKEQETGISIHYVNENYDEGQVIFQEKCTVYPDDTPGKVLEKVRSLELKNYPRIIEKVLMAKGSG